MSEEEKARRIHIAKIILASIAPVVLFPILCWLVVAEPSSAPDPPTTQEIDAQRAKDCEAALRRRAELARNSLVTNQSGSAATDRTAEYLDAEKNVAAACPSYAGPTPEETQSMRAGQKRPTPEEVSN